MISLEQMGFTCAHRRLFSDISLSILPGTLVRIVGPNGSGKSTFLKILAGLLEPSEGTILRSQDIKSSYIGHNIAVKDDLKLEEQLHFWASIEGTTMLIPAALTFLKIEQYRDDYCYKLSAGNKQKAALARLMLSKSMIWLLDEADTSLDKENMEIFKIASL